MLNRQQRATGVGCAIVSALVGLAVVVALVTEGRAIAVGGHSTISELFWLAFALQPGPFLLAAFVVGFVAGALAGHFFWQSRGQYDRIRREGL